MAWQAALKTKKNMRGVLEGGVGLQPKTKNQYPD